MINNEKTTLHLETLPPQTRKLFESIDSMGSGAVPFKLTERLFLAGGTALSLQIGHRISNDLDFACADEKLPSFAIEQFLELLKKNHKVQLVVPPAQISEFKIRTGLKLLDHVRDYNIDNVKVTFFLLHKNEVQRAFYQKAEKLSKQWTFPILGIEGLKLAKTLVLAERQRSRDLVDLMYLIRDHGYSISACDQYVANYGTNNNFEIFKSVMRGEMPLDEDDEAYKLLDDSLKLEDIYSFFCQQIDDYEIALARKLLGNTELLS